MCLILELSVRPTHCSSKNGYFSGFKEKPRWRRAKCLTQGFEMAAQKKLMGDITVTCQYTCGLLVGVYKSRAVHVGLSNSKSQCHMFIVFIVTEPLSFNSFWTTMEVTEAITVTMINPVLV